MSVMHWIALAACIGIGIYLTIALLWPEKFE
jgi:K+-transporting ATPase KdpF subunit